MADEDGRSTRKAIEDTLQQAKQEWSQLQPRLEPLHPIQPPSPSPAPASPEDQSVAILSPHPGSIADPSSESWAPSILPNVPFETSRSVSGLQDIEERLFTDPGVGREMVQTSEQMEEALRDLIPFPSPTMLDDDNGIISQASSSSPQAPVTPRAIPEASTSDRPPFSPTPAPLPFSTAGSQTFLPANEEFFSQESPRSSSPRCAQSVIPEPSLPPASFSSVGERHPIPFPPSSPLPVVTPQTSYGSPMSMSPEPSSDTPVPASPRLPQQRQDSAVHDRGPNGLEGAEEIRGELPAPDRHPHAGAVTTAQGEGATRPKRAAAMKRPASPEPQWTRSTRRKPSKTPAKQETPTVAAKEETTPTIQEVEEMDALASGDKFFLAKTIKAEDILQTLHTVASPLRREALFQKLLDDPVRGHAIMRYWTASYCPIQVKAAERENIDKEYSILPRPLGQGAQVQSMKHPCDRVLT